MNEESIDYIKARIPDTAKDIRLNVDGVLKRNTLPTETAYGVALAASIATGNRELILMVQRLQDNPQIQAGAETAAYLMAMTNAYYPFVEMTGDDNLKNLPPKLRMNAIASHGGVDKLSFEAFALAASIVGKCHFCVKSHYDLLKSSGMTVEQLQDIGKIASTIAAVAKIV